MKELQQKENCCGCTACVAVCSVGALTMAEDEEGFLYPKIDTSKCIHCNRCMEVCAFSVKQEKRKDKGKLFEGQYADPLVYAVRHIDRQVVMESRSGGIFTALSDLVLSQGGVVYGCVLYEVTRAVHKRADNVHIRDRMRGSKYIQSDLQDVFQSVREDLNSGKTVLFTGTSCQIDGLRAYLGADDEKLLCVDVVCHGVPSPKVWKSYIHWQEKRANSGCVSAEFRDKGKFGWRAHKETLRFANGKTVSSEVFKNIFYGHKALRPCCYQCPYKDIMHPGDITIADYWGIENNAPEYDDDTGVSLVLVNNEKGKALFDLIQDSIVSKRCDIHTSMQTPLEKPFDCPDDRAAFWYDYSHKNFTYVAKRHADFGWGNRFRRLVQRVWKKIVKKKGD